MKKDAKNIFYEFLSIKTTDKDFCFCGAKAHRRFYYLFLIRVNGPVRAQKIASFSFRAELGGIVALKLTLLTTVEPCSNGSTFNRIPPMTDVLLACNHFGQRPQRVLKSGFLGLKPGLSGLKPGLSCLRLSLSGLKSVLAFQALIQLSQALSQPFQASN